MTSKNQSWKLDWVDQRNKYFLPKKEARALMWVSACTEEVQNCRQIAAINTVIVTENQNFETSEGSRETVTQKGSH